jgi:hypothetical protein
LLLGGTASKVGTASRSVACSKFELLVEFDHSPAAVDLDDRPAVARGTLEPRGICVITTGDEDPVADSE